MYFMRLAGWLCCALFLFQLPIANAHTANTKITCGTVEFSYDYFADKPGNTISEKISIDGAQVYSSTFVFNGPSGNHLVPITCPGGTHSVKAEATWNTNGHSGNFSETASLNCPGVCERGNPNPAGAHASGKGFGLKAKVLVVSIAAVPTVSTTQSGVGTAHDDKQSLTINVPGVANVGVLAADSTSNVSSALNQARDSGFAEVSNVNLLNGVIKANVVRASVEAIARGDGSAFNTVGSTFEALTIGGVQYNNVAPNTRIALPSLGTGAYVILNERIGSTSAPAPGVLSGGTYAADITVNMIHVIVPALAAGLPPTTDIIVASATAHADFPQISMTAACVTNTGPRSVGAYAFVASTTVDAPLNASLVQGYTDIARSGGSSSQTLLNVSLPNATGSAVKSGTATTAAQGTVAATSSTSTANANVQNVSLLGGAVTATIIKTQSNSAANASARSSDPTGTQLVNIVLGGTPIANNPAPNTVYNLPGIGYVVFNEQIPDGAAPGRTGLTVRAIRVHVNKLAGVVPGAEVIVAESHSDAVY